MMLTRAVGPISMTVCSPPSRRVASLRPRFAGLTALDATAGVHPWTRDGGLDAVCDGGGHCSSKGRNRT